MTHRSISCRRIGTRKTRSKSQSTMTRETIVRSKPRRTYDMAGGWSSLPSKNWRRALDYFYPSRLAVFAAWKSGYLKTTALRDTLDRQSGMYRVAAKISDPQINDLVADFCRSDSGCLRTILWKRDRNGAIASTKLPKEKFDPAYDQVMACSRRPAGDARASHSEAATVPLLCQEACNLLVAECRKVVKGESA